MSVSILTGRVYFQSLSYGKYNELFNFPILSLGSYTNVFHIYYSKAASVNPTI